MSIEISVVNAAVIIFVFILTYIGIIHINIDKTTAAVFGGIVTMILVLILEMEDPHHPGIPIEQKDLIHPQDLEVIGLIVGFLMLVDVSAETGIFHYVAIKILKLSKGDPIKLLRYFGVLSVVLTVLVGNISAMMIIGSLTLIACERLELNPKPYIIVQLSMTTVGGIITIVASIPNIIIAPIFGMTFVEFFLVGGPWGVITMLVNFMIFERIYREEFKLKISAKELERRVNEFDEWSAVTSKKNFYMSAVILSLTILGFIFAEQMGLTLALIAITGGMTIAVLTGKKIDESMGKLDWSLIAFFMGLFILIAAMEAIGLLELIAIWMIEILPEDGFYASVIILWFVSLFSAIVDNIVVAAAFGPILATVAQANSSFSPMVIGWATIFGASFGGGLTPIGAPSAVIGLAMLKRKTGVKIGWGEFIKTQGFVTFVRLILSMFYLLFLSIVVYPV